jgi:hypothetical protein
MTITVFWDVMQCSLEGTCFQKAGIEIPKHLASHPEDYNINDHSN